jgi:D-galactarolactone cycloisomerase
MLTVERIETIPLLVPLGRIYKGSHYQMTHRAPVIVRIFTTEGIIGEAYVADEDRNFMEISRVIDKEITPLLIGRDIRSVERCWELTRPTTFDILRDRRIGLIATAAIDTAIFLKRATRFASSCGDSPPTLNFIPIAPRALICVISSSIVIPVP